MSEGLTFPGPEFLKIPNKEAAPISYTFIPSLNPRPSSHKRLIVFLNGLGLPASSWNPSITSLLRAPRTSRPAILTYDRFGQGLTTSRDPLDSERGKERGHDYMEVVADLQSLITVIGDMKLDVQGPKKIDLLIVAASIGANIARLYTQAHPGAVAGTILLDSNIANANYSAIWPDPDSPSFDHSILGDCTMGEYREARRKLAAIFDFNVKNAENLDRANSASLLPDAGAPKLVGTGEDGKGPQMTVVGHDPETFAELSWEMSGTQRELTNRFTNPYWAGYNELLRSVTDEGRCGPVVIAKGCGHFIQKDDPEFVAREVVCMLERLGW